MVLKLNQSENNNNTRIRPVLVNIYKYFFMKRLKPTICLSDFDILPSPCRSAHNTLISPEFIYF